MVVALLGITGSASVVATDCVAQFPGRLYATLRVDAFAPVAGGC